ncbi:glycosyltransferase family 2 protein [Flavobacterium pectinovorum]|uniref:glycosyltransferase family 2 protein n=1 Tax=Flavobacterium pectinovorum TaxID=29533 RepID=UPI001FAE3D81|nr:glycosyltransferase family 2 protein [Flavobacterium pectinovorum]MCI9846274.1 glycosyltransferase [Flavobacterium pectinovorum]
MKVSVITVCYNRKATIEQSIKSVLSQNYPNIEYIVIDGNSSDGTQDIIKLYSEKISKYVSESDKGMYDAINKGLSLATGDIVGLMHSDDVFYDKDVISKIVEAFQNSSDVDAIYGNGIYVTNDEEQKIVRNRIGGEYDYKRLKAGWLPLHPTVYIKKTVIGKYGNYNLDFKIASDTEFLLRYLYKHKIKVTYLNTYIVKMRMGGLSTNYKRAFEVLCEDYNIYKFHKLSGIRAVFQKKMLALMQYVKK